MARRTGRIGRAAGLSIGVFLALLQSAAQAAGSFADHAPLIIADLQALREPALFEHGGYDIAEAEGGYVVTLHDVRFVPVEHSYAEAGDVVARLTPEAGGYRITSFDLPREMPVRQAGRRARAGAVRLAGYDVDGHWAIEEQAFLSLDVEVSGLELAEAEGGATVAIESGHSSFVDTPGADGTWREEGVLEFHGLTSLSGNDAGKVGIFTMRWAVDDMDRDGVEEFKRLFVAAAQPADVTTAGPTPAELDRLRALGGLFGNGHATLEMRDVRLDGGPDRATVIGLGRIEIDGSDLDQELSRLGLRLQIEGMEVGVPGAAEGDLEDVMAPDSLDLSLAIEDLPGRAFWDAMLDSLAPAEMGHEEAMMRLGFALQAAGTRLRVGASRFTSPVSDVFAEGMLQAHGSAMLGAVIALSIDVVGLEALSALAAAQPRSESAAGLRELVGWLDRHGKAATAPSGASSRRVDIVLDADGQLTVNGEELPLFGDAPTEMEN